MDVIQCCMMIGWTYLESSSFILFASNLKRLVTEISEGICSELYFYAQFTWALQKRSKSSCYLPKVLVLGHKLVLGKPSNYVSNWWSGFLSNSNLRLPILRFMPTRFAIFMINICIYNHPFKNFRNKKYKGLKTSCVVMLERPIDLGNFSCKHGFNKVFMK